MAWRVKTELVEVATARMVVSKVISNNAVTCAIAVLLFANFRSWVLLVDDLRSEDFVHELESAKGKWDGDVEFHWYPIAICAEFYDAEGCCEDRFFIRRMPG